METKESEDLLEERAVIETSDTAPVVEAEKEAGSVENKYDIPTEDAKVLTRVTKLLDELHKKLPKLELRRIGGKYPCIMPNLGERKTLCYLYTGKKSLRIHTKVVNEEKKVETHNWAYVIRENGIFAHKEKVKQRKIINEICGFAKARKWI